MEESPSKAAIVTQDSFDSTPHVKSVEEPTLSFKIRSVSAQLRSLSAGGNLPHDARVLLDKCAKELDQSGEEADEIGNLVQTDPLTELYNRRGLSKELTRLQAMNERQIRNDAKYSNVESNEVIPYSMISFDLDGFKAINDTYSHAAGDVCLKLIAEAVSGVVRKTDTVAREGGDEFIVLLPEIDQESSYHVAKKIFEAIEVNVSQKLKELYPNCEGISASIGIINYNKAFASDNSLKEQDMVKYVDYIRYVVKAAGKKGILTFDEARSIDSNGELWRDYITTKSRE